MRLTKKGIDNNYVVDTYISLNEPWKSPIIKLGQLEDIEDELGIDLITLFKALKNGMYYKNIFNRNDRNVIHFAENYRLSFSYNETDYSLVYGTYTCICVFYFKDYGKTWALTKEELL